MLKRISLPFQIIYDIETVPCLETARRVYPQLETMAQEALIAAQASHDMDDPVVLDTMMRQIERDSLAELYKIAGATEANPEPFLKYFLHRVASISGISRTLKVDQIENKTCVELKWFTLPILGVDDLVPELLEGNMIQRFLRGVSEKQPQLIGWFSSFDMHVLLQRAQINGLSFPKLQRPAKPWDGADYFSEHSDYSIDLLSLISSHSPQSKCTLNEYARALRIPGKMGATGADVAQMWLNGAYPAIIAYNECDTATTYLIWLDMLRFSGHVTQEDYEIEQNQFRELLGQKIEAGANHLQEFVTEWDRLQGVCKCFCPVCGIAEIAADQEFCDELCAAAKVAS